MKDNNLVYATMVFLIMIVMILCFYHIRSKMIDVQIIEATSYITELKQEPKPQEEQNWFQKLFD
jgi:hypothetical protein